MDWSDALNYCANIAVCANGSIDGDQSTEGTCSGNSIRYDDWRLPTALEGIMIIDYRCTGGGDSGCFSDYQNAVFPSNNNYLWTGKTRPSLTHLAYLVYMDFGDVSLGSKVSDYSVRCVRDH
jgi:hypothetical protein